MTKKILMVVRNGISLHSLALPSWKCYSQVNNFSQESFSENRKDNLFKRTLHCDDLVRKIVILLCIQWKLLERPN